MSLKADLEAWTNALKAYDAEDFSKALDVFGTVTPDSKVYTNVGLIYATIGEHEAAVDNFREATGADNHLAIAYFQCGVSNFLLGRYEVAWGDFDMAFSHLRGNSAIFYEQLGMKFTLYSAEVLFNRGLCAVYNGDTNGGVSDMRSASGAKVTPEHGVIDEAIRDEGDGYTVFSVPVGVLYRPPESKMKNVAKKKFFGEAILVAAENEEAAFTGFHGSILRDRGLDPKWEPIKNFVPPQPRSPPPAPEAKKPATAPLPATKRSDTSPAREPAGKPQPPAITTGRGATGPSRGEPKDAREESPVSAPARSNTVRDGPRAGGAGPRGPGGGAGGRRSPPQSAFPAPTRQNSKAPPPAPPAGGRSPGARVTELYDDYLDGYTTDGAPQTSVPPTSAPPPMPPMPKQSRSRPPQSARTPSLYSSRTGRSRSIRRRPSQARLTAANVRMYDDEEGYETGDYEEDMYEFTKIKVKIHFEDEVRGMAIAPDLPHESFVERVTDKFGRAYGTLGFKFQDEDGIKVSLIDETDYEMAIETAREAAKGRAEGKLELWCFDIKR